VSAVTTKGQVTIPKPIRDLLGVVPGSKVEFVMDDQGQIILRKAGDAPPLSLSRFLGVMKGDMTTDQIMALTRGED
jgi:AbrB family looped-hinge helix DNA binding protein